jgi:hypothetical protein
MNFVAFTLFFTFLIAGIVFLGYPLLAPITLLGLTALSVETMTNFTTLCSQAKSARFLVPSILNGLRRVFFHQRHMLVCGSVKHHVGFVQFEHFTQCLFISDIRDYVAYFST